MMQSVLNQELAKMEINSEHEVSPIPQRFTGILVGNPNMVMSEWSTPPALSYAAVATRRRECTVSASDLRGYLKVTGSQSKTSLIFHHTIVLS